MEGVYYYFNTYDNFMSFIERPKYQVYAVNDTDGDYHITINKVGTVKDCGVFTESKADDYVKFINEFPAVVPLYAIFLYSLVTVFQIIGDIIYTVYYKWRSHQEKKVKDDIDYSTINNTERAQAESYIESDFNKDCLFFINKIIPLFKLVCLGPIYPYTSIEYETCLSINSEILLDENFLNVGILVAWILSNGLLSLVTYRYLEKCFLKYFLSCWCTVYGGFSCFLWLLFHKNNKKLKKCKVTCCCFIPLAIISFSLMLGIFGYMLLTLFGLPYLTNNYYSYGLNSILFLRTMEGIFSICKKK